MSKMQEYLNNPDMDKIKFVLEIKEAYQAGEIDLQSARQKIKERVVTLRPEEIALAEQELKEFSDDECRKEDIQKMMELFEDVMDTSRPKLPEDHPIMCYFRENDACRKILKEIEDLVQYPVIKNQWMDVYERLSDFRIHLSRKQNQLYSLLEQKGFDRPTTTMWTLDDFIRDEIRDAFELLKQDKDDDFIRMQPMIIADTLDLMQKEETVLYPTSLAMISDEEFEDMKSGDREIGFAWIDAGAAEPVKAKVSKPAAGDNFAGELQALLAKHGYGHRADEVFDVATGKLTLDQINLIYRHLPVDLSYVDENNSVCFYSDTEHRVFPRSKNVIGRNVENCHPRGSVHIVREIIEKFRSGEEDRAEFWINKPDLFIYILYTAVRDEEGRFRGVLEMMQDCTHIRSLQGSQTLLTWGSKAGIVTEEAPVEEKTEEKADEDVKPVDISTIGPETRLKDLLAVYPQLKNDLEKINPAFKMLKTPLARIMIPKATVQIMSERSGMELAELIEKLKDLLAGY